jgi:hypothetical protein
MAKADEDRRVAPAAVFLIGGLAGLAALPFVSQPAAVVFPWLMASPGAGPAGFCAGAQGPCLPLHEEIGNGYGGSVTGLFRGSYLSSVNVGQAGGTHPERKVLTVQNRARLATMRGESIP